MQIDQALVDELREMARQGQGACATAKHIGHRLEQQGNSYRLAAIAYFQAAFGLELADAMRIGAAPAFEPGRAESEVDAEIQPLLDQNRHVWGTK